MRGFNIDERLVQVIQELYLNASGAVLFNVQQGDFFRTAVGVRLACWYDFKYVVDQTYFG
ncbi:hypothetical protein DPMN_016963 [Dreissena polymorpha]|uniref:Uncharacterized protein n=1 Tax=Dreissena polymorpha TaxID=45954 RepID=A0A9D4S5Y8_DREPO|nr:hypothetical protein DPMN_016963 [Dreissena polymorpha]